MRTFRTRPQTSASLEGQSKAFRLHRGKSIVTPIPRDILSHRLLRTSSAF